MAMILTKYMNKVPSNSYRLVSPCKTNSASEAITSSLHKTQTEHTDPMKLFEEWYYKPVGDNPNDPPLSWGCVATASKNGDVSARFLRLMRLDEDGFVLLTNNQSMKAKQVVENPQAEMARIHGFVKQLPNEDAVRLYEAGKLYKRIRSVICNQGQSVSWDSLKKHHDEILHGVKNENMKLEKPDYTVWYKIYPRRMEFYECYSEEIADRLSFVKTESKWQMSRIAA